jgi:uncharacterized protein YndB with AHSA1/START domain
MSNTVHGYFLISDITGYTSYLSQSELDHAQDTLTALLNLLIDHTRPPLIISRLAGDAVISYGLLDNFFQGQTFVELIENTYVAFRRMIDLMVLNTKCPCNACKNIKSLDLKFFVHFGAFGIQKLDAHDELIGSDIILLHRLLKNKVVERTGYPAYTLFTDAAIRQLGLDEFCNSMTPHTEEYTHLGEVKTWIQDMRPIWELKKDQLPISFPEKDLIMRVTTDIAHPPERVWDFLIQPAHFNVLAGGTRTEIEYTKVGRVTVGTTYQCYHGDSNFPQTILEWQPFERILVQILAPIPVNNTSLPVEYRLVPISQGTRLVQSFGKASGPPHGRMMANVMFKRMARIAQRDIDNFGKHVEAEIARQSSLPKKKLIHSPVFSSVD